MLIFAAAVLSCVVLRNRTYSNRINADVAPSQQESLSQCSVPSSFCSMSFVLLHVRCAGKQAQAERVFS